MARNWAERKCTVAVLDGREQFLMVRQAADAELPPALTAAVAVDDLILAGYNNGTLRMWSLKDAVADEAARPDEAGRLGLRGAASVRLVLREQPSLIWPDASPAGDQPNYVSAIAVAGARLFSAHSVFPPVYELGDSDDDGDSDPGAVGRTAAERDRARPPPPPPLPPPRRAPVSVGSEDGEALEGAEPPPWTGPFVSVWDQFTGRPIAALPVPADALTPPPSPAAPASPARSSSPPPPPPGSDVRPRSAPLGQAWSASASTMVLRSLAAVADGSRVVAACSTGYLAVWDSALTGAWELLDTVVAHADGIVAALPVPSTKRDLLLLTGSAGLEGGARLFRIGEYAGRTGCISELRGVDQVLCLAATASRLVVASQPALLGGQGSRIAVYDPASPVPLLANVGRADAGLHAHTPRSLHLADGCDPATLAVGTRDGSVRLYDLRSNLCVQVLHGHLGTASARCRPMNRPTRA